MVMFVRDPKRAMVDQYGGWTRSGKEQSVGKSIANRLARRLAGRGCLIGGPGAPKSIMH
jgi:hypothetical protein